LSLGV